MGNKVVALNPKYQTGVDFYQKRPWRQPLPQMAQPIQFSDERALSCAMMPPSLRTSDVSGMVGATGLGPVTPTV